jgi:hypothetical protein
MSRTRIAGNISAAADCKIESRLRRSGADSKYK